MCSVDSQSRPTNSTLDLNNDGAKAVVVPQPRHISAADMPVAVISDLVDNAAPRNLQILDKNWRLEALQLPWRSSGELMQVDMLTESVYVALTGSRGVVWRPGERRTDTNGFEDDDDVLNDGI